MRQSGVHPALAVIGQGQLLQGGGVVRQAVGLGELRKAEDLSAAAEEAAGAWAAAC